MPDEIRRIDYYYTSVSDRPGAGARILAALHDAGVNLIGVSAFPHGARRSGGRCRRHDQIPAAADQVRHATLMGRLQKFVVNLQAIVNQPACILLAQYRRRLGKPAPWQNLAEGGRAILWGW